MIRRRARARRLGTIKARAQERQRLIGQVQAFNRIGDYVAKWYALTRLDLLSARDNIEHARRDPRGAAFALERAVYWLTLAEKERAFARRQRAILRGDFDAELLAEGEARRASMQTSAPPTIPAPPPFPRDEAYSNLAELARRAGIEVAP